MMKEWPAPMVPAFFLANSVIAGSVPDQRTRHLPDASQKASPNLMPGTAATSASWMSSTDLMKWVWPRTKLVSSGFSIFTVLSCMAFSLDVSRRSLNHDEPRLRPTLAELDLREVGPDHEAHRFDGLDDPAVCEG